MLRAVILAALVLSGCEESAPPGPPASGEYAELAGSWSASVAQTPYGAVAGSAEVSASGVLFYIVTAKGTQLRGQAQIVDWSGESLTVALPDGKRSTASAALSEDQLIVSVPSIGDIVLTRASNDSE